MKYIFSCVILLISAVNNRAGAQSFENFQSARKLVSAFFAWYIPKSSIISSAPSWEIVLSERSWVLSKRLKDALEEERQQTQANLGYADGLDFDPFLGSQDSCTNYTINDSKHVNNEYIIKVSLFCGAGVKVPPIDIDVTEEAGRFVIANVTYGKKTSLLKVISDEHLRH